MFIVLLVRVCVDLLNKEEIVPLYEVDHYHPYLANGANFHAIQRTFNTLLQPFIFSSLTTIGGAYIGAKMFRGFHFYDAQLRKRF